jgi:hypothetical protein
LHLQGLNIGTTYNYPPYYWVIPSVLSDPNQLKKPKKRKEK